MFGNNLVVSASRKLIISSQIDSCHEVYDPIQATVFGH